MIKRNLRFPAFLSLAVLGVLISVKGNYLPLLAETKEVSLPKSKFYIEKLGDSVEKRPIMATIWNKNSRTHPCLVIAGVHGDERVAGEFGKRLDETWNKRPEELGKSYVIFIPMANPDGWKRRTRQNAHKVDINRNFPFKWRRSKPGSRHYSGPKPLSEPETGILKDLIDKNKPRMIITFHCPLNNVNYDGPAEELAKEMREYNHMKVVANIGYPTPGSLGNYAGVHKKIPTITLEFPRRKLDQVWEHNYKAVMAAIKFKLKGRGGKKDSD
jgi:predicted deacylase